MRVVPGVEFPGGIFSFPGSKSEKTMGVGRGRIKERGRGGLGGMF